MRADVQRLPITDGFITKSNPTPTLRHLRSSKPAPPPPPRRSKTSLPPPHKHNAHTITLHITPPTQTQTNSNGFTPSYSHPHPHPQHKISNYSHSSLTSSHSSYSHRSLPSLPSLPSPPSRPSYSQTSPRQQLKLKLPSPKQPQLTLSKSVTATTPKGDRFAFPSPSPDNHINYNYNTVQRVNTYNIMTTTTTNDYSNNSNKENLNLNIKTKTISSSMSYHHLPQIVESPRHHRLSTTSTTSRSTRSSSYGSSRSCNSPRTSVRRKKSWKRKDGRNVECICGRKMNLTQNPRNKYPPNAVLYCQQNAQCKKKLIVQKDWFYVCKKRTNYHNTKNGKYYKICYSCSISLPCKQERIRKNHQLLIKQIKNNDVGQVVITKDTKNYILSSSTPNSKDETIRLLRQIYIDGKGKEKERGKRKRGSVVNVKMEMMSINNNSYKIIKKGFMMKKGNFWNKSFKKRYFKLCENKQLFYYKELTDKDERGIADLNETNNIIKKGNNGLEVITPSREWKFLCTSNNERDEWYIVFRKLLL